MNEVQHNEEENLPPPPIISVPDSDQDAKARSLAPESKRDNSGLTFKPAPPPQGAPGPVLAQASQQPPEGEPLVLESPGNDEIADYAKYLGMKPVEDAELLWIAEQALCAPLPPGWRVFEDHVGRPYFFSSETRKAQWEHPLDDDYRQLFRSMRRALRDTVSYAEVTMMAVYLGIDADKEAGLMWIARQAVLAPLPQGWEEREDEHGLHYVDTQAGESQRFHPLDPVFKMLLRVERERLAKGQFSFARIGGNGSADERQAVMRLSDDKGQVYWFDWVSRKRVEGPPGDGKRRRRGSEGGDPYLPEDPTLEPSPANYITGNAEEAGQSTALTMEGPAPATPGSARGGGGGQWGSKPAGSRLPVTLRTLAASTSKQHHNPSPMRQARDEMGGSVGGMKRGGTGVRSVAAARPSVVRKYGAGAWEEYSPYKISTWIFMQAWSLALLIPLLKRYVPQPKTGDGG